MVFLKWCPYMVFLYDFLGTWQQGHIEVYKQHVDMVILLAFFRLNDNSGFSRCFFFQIILSQIFIKTLWKLSSYKEVLMKYFTVLNYIIRWQNDSTLWMFCNMVISISFLLLFPLWQKGRIKIFLLYIQRVFFSWKITHFMEGMLYLDNSKKIRTDNFDFLKLEKNTILQGKWSKTIFGIKRVKNKFHCFFFPMSKILKNRPKT